MWLIERGLSVLHCSLTMRAVDVFNQKSPGDSVSEKRHQRRWVDAIRSIKRSDERVNLTLPVRVTGCHTSVNAPNLDLIYKRHQTNEVKQGTKILTFSTRLHDWLLRYTVLLAHHNGFLWDLTNELIQSLSSFGATAQACLSTVCWPLLSSSFPSLQPSSR
jgi:hypothetical protein